MQEQLKLDNDSDITIQVTEAALTCAMMQVIDNATRRCVELLNQRLVHNNKQLPTLVQADAIQELVAINNFLIARLKEL